MSVTINGDGTVTGLAALPNTAMASSTVIQAACSSANDLSQVNTSSNDYSDITGCDLLFTPKFSTSTIILAATDRDWETSLALEQAA